MGLLKKSLIWTYRGIKKQDMFPQTMNFTIKGESDFRTFHGGVFSTLIKLFMLLYLVTLVIRLVSNTETNKSVNTIVNNTGNDETKHYIGNSTFGVALQLKGEHPEYLYDPSYFRVHFVQRQYTNNGSNHPSVEHRDIESKL